MELKDVIVKRRSVKKYKPDMVPQELIDQVVDAGLRAACGKGARASVVIVVKDKELRDKISACNGAIMGLPEGKDPFYGAPVILVVIAKADVPTAPYDGACTLQNMMLKATDLGLGSCWIHRCKEEFEGELGKEILAKVGLEGNYVGVGHLALGYAAEGSEREFPVGEGRCFQIG